MTRKVLTDDLNMNGHHLRGWDYLSDIPQGGATLGQALVWDGEQYSPGIVAFGSGTVKYEDLLDSDVLTVKDLLNIIAGFNSVVLQNSITLNNAQTAVAEADNPIGMIVKTAANGDQYFGWQDELDMLKPNEPGWQTDAAMAIGQGSGNFYLQVGRPDAPAGRVMLGRLEIAASPTGYQFYDDIVTDSDFYADGTAYIGGEVRCDRLVERNPAAGVAIQNVVTTEAGLLTDTIGEETLDAGVTIDGLLIKDGGIAAYDAHLIDFTNPHLVSKAQVGLGNVTDDAQLKRSDNDWLTFASVTPATSANVLYEAAVTGKKQTTSLANLPISLATQAALDLKQDSLAAGVNIDPTDFAADIVSVVDAPTFTGTCTADKIVVAELDQATKDNIISSFAVTHAGVDASAYRGIISDMVFDVAAGSVDVHQATAFASAIVLINNTPAVFSPTFHVIDSTFDADGLSIGVSRPLEFAFTNPAATQEFAEGYLSLDIDAGNSGTSIAARTRIMVGGTARGMGYSGYATSVGGGATSTLIGVQGLIAEAAGDTYVYAAALDGLYTASSSTPADRLMGMRCVKHALIRGGSLFITDDATDNSPADVTPDHVDALNNVGELFVEGVAEFDSEVFCDSNETGSIVSVTSTYTAAGFTTIFASGTFDITLPAAATVTGRKYKIKNTGSGVVTVEGDGAETIDEALNIGLIQHEVIEVQSDGTEWWIV